MWNSNLQMNWLSDKRSGVKTTILSSEMKKKYKLAQNGATSHELTYFPTLSDLVYKDHQHSSLGLSWLP